MILNFVGGSGGAGLNFAVVGSLTEPASPAENTLWVQTEAAVTGYCFDSVQPEGEDGMVWICTAASGGARFNALKENGVYLCLIRVMQYMDGEWTSVTAKIWLDGTWSDLWDGFLYTAGNECTAMTGGWMAEAVPRSSGGNASKRVVTCDSSGLKVGVDIGYSGIFRTVNKVELTGKTSLVFEGTMNNPSESEAGFYCSLCLWNEIGEYYRENVAAAYHSEYGTYEGTVTLDISGLEDGAYYVGFCLYGSATVFMAKLQAL